MSFCTGGNAVPPANTTPLPGAIRIIDLTGDDTEGVSVPWLSDHELLHFKKGVALRYDLSTGEDTRLDTLTREIQYLTTFLYSISVSPDGKFLLWHDINSTQAFNGAFDGSLLQARPWTVSRNHLFWCADSRHWVDLQADASIPRTASSVPRFITACLQTVGNGSSQLSTPIPDGLRSLEVLSIVSEHTVIARTPDPMIASAGISKPPTIRPQKRVRNTTQDAPGLLSADTTAMSVSTSATTLRTTQMISVWDLHTKRPLHRYAVTLPGVAASISVSADGRRVAWFLILPPYSDHAGIPVSRASLWVSQLDGSGLREIGVIKEFRHSVMGNDMPSLLRWVPGGRRISFVYGGSLWTIPVQ